MIHVVSVGPGASMQLTPAARSAIDGADVVFAAARHREFANVARPLDVSLEEIASAFEAGRTVAVLVSGDAGVFSLLPRLAERFGLDVLCVHPGVSALQSLCAALGESWHDARILSGHGRALSISALGYAVRTSAKTLLFCDGDRGAAWAARALLEEGLLGVSMAVGERLSYEDQRITKGVVERFLTGQFDALSVVMIKNPAPEPGLPGIGIADEAFLRGTVPMTKREIRAQILCELSLPPDAVVWDIGAGTGSVSVECARQCPLGEVIGIERDEDALSLLAQNKAKFRANNLRVIAGVAPKALAGLPDPTHVFIGGSGGRLVEMLNLIESLPGTIRVAATAVTMGSAETLIERLSRWAGFRMTQHAVSRVEEVGNAHMLHAQNPVFIASATWEVVR